MCARVCVRVCTRVYTNVRMCVCMCSQIIFCCARHLERGKSLGDTLHWQIKVRSPIPHPIISPHTLFFASPHLQTEGKNSFLENYLDSQNVISLTSFFSQLPFRPTPGCWEKGRGSSERFQRSAEKGVGRCQTALDQKLAP